MKKFFVLATVLALVLTGCDTNGGGDDDWNNYAKLTIYNQSSFNIKSVSWGNGETPLISTSKSDFIAVNESTSGYLFFTFTYNWLWGDIYRTQEIVSVSKGDTGSFTITNNTLIVDLNDTTNTPKTLQEMLSQ